MSPLLDVVLRNVRLLTSLVRKKEKKEKKKLSSYQVQWWSILQESSAELNGSCAPMEIDPI